MTIEQLKTLMNSGRFHHATYRDHGTIWEGLWIYEKSEDRLGYKPVGSFPKGTEDEAYKLVRSSGVYEGSYR
jgi:hypothetical protein